MTGVFPPWNKLNSKPESHGPGRACEPCFPDRPRGAKILRPPSRSQRTALINAEFTERLLKPGHHVFYGLQIGVLPLAIGLDLAGLRNSLQGFQLLARIPAPFKLYSAMR